MTVLTLSMAPLLSRVDNARDWQNLPTDLNMVFGYYNKIDTNTPIDTSLPIDEPCMPSKVTTATPSTAHCGNQFSGGVIGDLGH